MKNVQKFFENLIIFQVTGLRIRVSKIRKNHTFEKYTTGVLYSYFIPLLDKKYFLLINRGIEGTIITK